MVPEKHEELIRGLAYQDGVDAAESGDDPAECEWMRGTIFFDDYMDGYRSAGGEE